MDESRRPNFCGNRSQVQSQNVPKKESPALNVLKNKKKIFTHFLDCGYEMIATFTLCNQEHVQNHTCNTVVSFEVLSIVHF